MRLSLYVEREGFAHGLHPVTKILGALLLFWIPLAFRDPLTLAIEAAATLALVLAAGAAPALRRVGRLIVVLVLATGVLWSFFYPGASNAAWKLGPVRLSLDGFHFGLGMGLRLACMVMGGILFLATTKVEDFTLGLTRLGVPYTPSFTLSLAFRLVPTFVDMAQTIAQAQRARGLDLDSGGFVERARRYRPILVPIFVSALRRADLLAMALEARGFGASRPRTSIAEHRFRKRDAVALSFLAAAAAGATVARLLGYGAFQH